MITCDESWIHYFNQKLKRVSENCIRKKEVRSKKVHQQKLVGKVMLISFFDSQGLVYQHICPLKMKVTSQYYFKGLQQLKKKSHIWHKCTDIRLKWILHQGNTRPHITALVMARLGSPNIDTMVLHPPQGCQVIMRKIRVHV